MVKGPRKTADALVRNTRNLDMLDVRVETKIEPDQLQRRTIMSRLTRRAFVTVSAAGAMAVFLPVSASASEPPEIAKQLPVTVANGLSVTHVYDRTSTPARAWALDVRNETNQIANPPEILISFFDTEQNVLGETQASPFVKIVGSGQTVPYRVEFFDFDPTSEWDHFTFSTTTAWPQSPFVTSEGMTVSNLVPESGENRWRMMGRITNSTDVQINNITLTAIVRDAAGNFLGTTWDIISTPVLAGKWGAFTLDAGYQTFVPFSPFAFGAEASQFEFEVVATRPV